MFRWLNRSDSGKDKASELQAIERMNESIQEFFPGSVEPDYQVIGHCDGCGSLIWGHPSKKPQVLSHCRKCSEEVA